MACCRRAGSASTSTPITNVASPTSATTQAYISQPLSWPYDRNVVKLLIILTVVGALILVPFVKLRQRWAVDLWRRIRLVVIVYCIVVFAAAVARLVFNWDAIYG